MNSNLKIQTKTIDHKHFRFSVWMMQLIFTLLFSMQVSWGSKHVVAMIGEEIGNLMPKSVLCFHGGGGRGLISASILKALENRLPTKNINDYVTHYAGNSTGSILAAALALGKTPDDLIEFYIKNGPDIFSFEARNLLYPVSTKYDRKIFDRKLEENFGTIALKDLKKGLLIMANQLEFTQEAEQGPIFFNSEDPTYHDFLLKDIVAGSCSAPSIFDPYMGIKGYKLIDGGVVENNPGMGAYWAFKGDDRDLLMINFGTGRFTNVYDYRSTGLFGMWNWLTSLPHMATRDSSVLIDRRLKAELAENYIYFNPILEEYIEMDDMSPAAIVKIQGIVSKYVSRSDVQRELDEAAAYLVLRKNEGLATSQMFPTMREAKN